MRLRQIFALLALPFLLLGCLSKPVNSIGSIDDFAVEIWSSNTCVQPGETIKLRATVTNRGAKTEIIESKKQPILDIMIRNQGPEAHWSDGKVPITDAARLELKPNESLSIEMDWTVKSPSSGSVFYVDARFAYLAKFSESSMPPSILINVGICPGPLGL